MKRALIGLIFLAAAALEVGGDALIRRGIKGAGVIWIVLGFLALGCYGLMVNVVKWDFSRLIGTYVSVFAIFSVLTGLFIFKEAIPWGTWVGLALIAIGGFIIQFSAASY